MAATKKLNANAEYLLIDPFGDPVYYGSADEIKVFLEDIFEIEGDPGEHKYTARVLGQEVPLYAERVTLVTVGREA